MKGIKHLLLLAAFVHLARCQPKVSMSPPLEQIFSGDLFYLRCNSSTGGSRVTWYHNGKEQMMTNDTWKIEVAAPEHSGTYQCESNGQKSDVLNITVLDYVPSASLTLETGQPVMRNGGSVVLQLDNEDGLQGWRCWVCRGRTTKKIMLRLTNDNTSVVFQPRSLDVPETIFWCTDTQQNRRRSNQITIRTSEKAVSLEMYPLPLAMFGESLTLRCLVWGTDRISRTVFYKNDEILYETLGSTYKIPDVTESAKGKYKCDATFTYTARSDGPPYQVVSDNQEVFVQAPPIKAVLSVGVGMSCSCPLCPDNSSYRWYHTDGGPSWARMDSSQESMKPEKSGTYACRAVWSTGRSFLSNGYDYQPPSPLILICVIVVLLILGSAVLLFYLWYKRRNTTGPIYEDMPLRSRDKGDEYEKLQTGAKREAEYDALQPEAPQQRREGEYEALKKEEMTGGEYHTVRMEGAAGGGEGGYEALKKEGMKGGEYHTVRMEGAAGGGEGGYEALKKEGMKGGEYSTLGAEGAAKGGGGYEALRKEGMKEGVYSTLGAEGAGGGEWAYEAGGKTDKD